MDHAVIECNIVKQPLKLASLEPRAAHLLEATVQWENDKSPVAASGVILGRCGGAHCSYPSKSALPAQGKG